MISMEYNLIFFASTLVLLCFVLLKYAVLRAKYRDTIEAKSIVEQELENHARISREQEIQLRYLEKLHYESKNIQDAHFNAAKLALLDIGKELNKELLNQHKVENEQNKKLTDQNISKVNVEFVKIAGIVQSLGDQFIKSQKSMDVIKNSLLNPTGAGQLAEITLENVLRNSGLLQDIDFFIQPQFSNADNKKLRPDAIVLTPSSLIIVDAKSSANLMLGEQNLALDAFMRTMNQHLKSLTSKEYVNFVKEFPKISHRFVDARYPRILTVMFVPTESLVEKIMNADHEFVNKCWENGIYVTGPTGLMNILSLSKIEIQESERARNHEAIISEVRKLLDSLGVLIEHSSKFGSSIQSLVVQYDKFVGSFNRNFLSKARNIQKLGIHANKSNITLKRYQLITTSEILDTDCQEEPDSEQMKISC